MMKNDPVQITREKARAGIETVKTAEKIMLSEAENELFAHFADVLEYPGDTHSDLISKCGSLAKEAFAGSSPLLHEFADAFHELTLDESREYYSRTFDLNPVCGLDIGHHLFGEDYKRGAFLANLRETQLPYELKQEFQLPDFLPVLLRLMTKLDNDELRASLIGCCLLPALKTMKEALKKKENVYGDAIGFLESALLSIAEQSLHDQPGVENERYQYA